MRQAQFATCHLDGQVGHVRFLVEIIGFAEGQITNPRRRATFQSASRISGQKAIILSLTLQPDKGHQVS
jgi:hypothetical protein